MASVIFTGRFKPLSGAIRVGKLPALVVIVVNWVTSAGSLGEFVAGAAIDPITLEATTSPSGSAVTYAVTSGSLPTGLSLSNGVISGTVNGALPESTATFTIRATSDGFFADREFSIDVLSAPEWVTPAGQLTSINLDEDFMETVMVSANRNVEFEMVTAPDNFTVEGN